MMFSAYYGEASINIGFLFDDGVDAYQEQSAVVAAPDYVGGKQLFGNVRLERVYEKKGRGGPRPSKLPGEEWIDDPWIGILR